MNGSGFNPSHIAMKILQSVAIVVEDAEVDIPVIHHSVEQDQKINLSEKICREKYFKRKKRADNFIAYYMEEAKRALEPVNKQRLHQIIRNGLKALIAITVFLMLPVVDVPNVVLGLSIGVSMICIAYAWPLVWNVIDNFRKYISKPKPIFPDWLMTELIILDYRPPVCCVSRYIVSDILKRTYSDGCLKKSVLENEPDEKRQQHVRRWSTGGNIYLEHSAHAVLRKRYKTDRKYFD